VVVRLLVLAAASPRRRVRELRDVWGNCGADLGAEGKLTMASIYNRGTDERPIWWVKYKDTDGAWKAVKAKGTTTKGEAHRFADGVDERIAKGLPPVDLERQATTPDAVTCGTLMRPVGSDDPHPQRQG
jgi:hypothetical protein